MAARSRRSGRSMRIWRSKRPGRRRAVSRVSGRLVAAIRITPLSVLNPSISTNNWLSVFSRSSLPPMMPPLPRDRPTASISSMKMMQGAFSLACLNRSRTRAAPTPTNISTKSLPEREKNGDLSLAGDGLRQQRLARARRPDQEHALGQLAAQLGEPLGVLKELDHLLDLLLSLVQPGHVGEGDGGALGLVEQRRPCSCRCSGPAGPGLPSGAG